MSEPAIDNIGLELPVNDAMLYVAEPLRIAVEAGLKPGRQAAPLPAVVPVDLGHEAIQEPSAKRLSGEAGTAPPGPDGYLAGACGLHFLDGVHGILRSSVDSSLSSAR